MRIVAGRWRGRTIRPPSDPRVRPTADRVREAWMSIVNPLLPDARVLDLFAGSGALGLEALSRGARSADFVELSRPGVDAIRANAASLGADTAIRIHRQDALQYAERLEAGTFDVAFADPPYGLSLAERLATLWLERPFARVLGVEHSTRETMPSGGDMRRYGTSAISFYRVEGRGSRV